MRNKDVSVKFIFGISLFFLVLFAVSVLLFKPGSYLELNKDSRVLMVIAGILFWVSLIISHTAMLFVTLKRKNYFKKNGIKLNLKLPAVITFFSSKAAKIIDIALFLSIIVLVLLLLLSDGFEVFLMLSITILLFEAHCVANGKNVRYIKMICSEADAK